MIDPIQIHKLRVLKDECQAYGASLGPDLDYIIHAYDTMIVGLQQIREETSSPSIAELCDELLERVEYVGPNY